MFHFVVKRLSFLKEIPLLPHLFDSLVKLWVFLTNPQLSRLIDDIEYELADWENVRIHLHKYGGTQFDVFKKEIGHVHSNGLLDILFDIKTKAEFLNEGRIQNHHVFEKSGWISFYVRNERDKKYAMMLLRKAYLNSVQGAAH